MELSVIEEEQIIKTETDLNEISLEQDYPPLNSIKREPDTCNKSFSSDYIEEMDSMNVKTETDLNEISL